MLDHLHFEEPYEKEKDYVIVGYFCRLCGKKERKSLLEKKQSAIIRAKANVSDRSLGLIGMRRKRK